MKSSTLLCLVYTVATLYTSGASAHKKEGSIPLIIGGYTSNNEITEGDEIGSEGVYTTLLDLSTGALSEPILAFRGKDPTFLTVSKKNIIYGALRESGGLVNAVSLDNHQQFSPINHQATQGGAPCYISLSANEKFVATANYVGGNVSVFSLSPSGEVMPNPTILTHRGSSVNKNRQKSPHPHWVQWSPHNDSVIYVIDLGIDKVMKYKLDPITGKTSKGSVAFSSKPGAGPRHLVFHPTKKLAYILNELTNTVDLVNIESDDSFTLMNKVSTLPESYSGHNQGAHIAISSSGKTLYTSNRGLNSIAIFNLDDHGAMTLKENVNTGGDWPRFFALLEQEGYLVVANKKSNNIVVFKVKDDGGLIKTQHHLLIEQPTFIGKY